MKRNMQGPFRGHGAFILLLAALSFCALQPGPSAFAQKGIHPVLEFPERGIDDPAAYAGYATRIYRDGRGNAVQVMLHRDFGRIIALCADAADESMAFCLRDTSGRKEEVSWGSAEAFTDSAGSRRFFTFPIRTVSTAVDAGLFLLGSMRIEREFQYARRYNLPFDSLAYVPSEVTQLIADISRVPDSAALCALLKASSAGELAARTLPSVRLTADGTAWTIRVEQRTFDGRNTLSLDIGGLNNFSSVEAHGAGFRIRSKVGQPLELRVRIGTDSPPLTPLGRGEIFNGEFLQFLARAEGAYDSLAGVPAARRNEAARSRMQQCLWIDREVKGIELLCYREKLMAGLPNYATYFGRDMLMTTLMMEPVWTPAMEELVVTSVLRKLRPDGNVSHEEGLGGEAIRENAERCSELLAARTGGDSASAAASADELRSLLGDLQRTTENYRMVDDDFELAVLAARYLARSDVPAMRKKEFLEGIVAGNVTRAELLLRNVEYVLGETAPFAAHPDALHLVGFPRWERGWISSSWRDSGPGYGGGRFAFDVNAAWAPHAVEAARTILAAFTSLGVRLKDAAMSGETAAYLRNPDSLDAAIRAWSGARRFFDVGLSAAEVNARLAKKLAWMSREDRAYWEELLRRTKGVKGPITFPALALDSAGAPIPLVSTDPATLLFLDDATERVRLGALGADSALAPIEAILRPYPAGLFVDRLGPLVVNDAYTGKDLWDIFRNDTYHSPSVVWGREVNLLILALAKQIRSAYDSTGRVKEGVPAEYVARLRGAVEKIVAAADASNLRHEELWTYRIRGGKLVPERWPVSTDVQLWNLTGLAVRFELSRLSR